LINIIKLERRKSDKRKKRLGSNIKLYEKTRRSYLIRNVTKEDAIYIAENQNQSPHYDCSLIKEDVSDGEDEETSIRPLDYQKEVK
jgi:hypothetical protein